MDDVSYRGLRRRLFGTLVVLAPVPLLTVYAAVFATNALLLDVLGAALGRRFYGSVYVEPWAAVAFAAVAVAVGAAAVQAWLRDLVVGGASALPRRHLDDRVTALAGAVGVDAPAVRAVGAGQPTAFTVPSPPDGRVLVVSDALRASLSDAELDAVVLHELAHVRNRDATATTVAAGVLAFLAPLALPLVAVRAIYASLPGEAKRSPNPGWFLTLPFAVLAFVPALPYFVARTVLARGCWRYREHVADSAAATLVDPDALAIALETVSAHRRANQRALGIVDGFLFVPFDESDDDGPGEFPLWPSRLQPATDARIERIRNDVEGDREDADDDGA